MIYMADTANIEELKKLYYYFPLAGVTTNPSILAVEKKPISEIIPSIVEIVGDGMIHIQVSSTTADEMLREALKYKEYFGLGENYYSKIPVTKEGLRAMRLIKDAGIHVTATAIFTHQQALVAAQAGADFVAPYVSRLDNISSHGIEVVEHITKTMDHFNYDCKVLAASFKTVDQVHRIVKRGCHSATINFELLEALRSHPMTDMAVDRFAIDSQGIYDIEF
ncbi:transaldolase family protein [Pontiellaceae bacterium B12219]|nr:transaldolase family protein [Pontiellaceae bacterium B12219]